MSVIPETDWLPPLTDLEPLQSPVAVQLVGDPLVVQASVEVTGDVPEEGVAVRVTPIALMGFTVTYTSETAFAVLSLVQVIT